MGHKDRNGRVAIESFVDTVRANIQRNGCTLRIVRDTMRKQLNSAYHWFSSAATQAMDLSSHGVEGFDHVSRVCPACVGAQSFYRKIAGCISDHSHDILGATTTMPADVLANDGDGVGGDAQVEVGLAGLAGRDVDGAEEMELLSGVQDEVQDPGSAAGAAAPPGLGARADGAGLANLIEVVENSTPTFMRPVETATPLHSGGCDACFALHHEASAGSATPYDPDQEISSYMVPDKIVEEACRSKPFAAKGTNAKDCADLTASKAFGRSSTVYDKTGVMAVTCRHHFVLAMCNLFTGKL